ncbi:hypothetical protein GCM10008949_50040 [Deinococcus humi]|nr:hypothetical protein GCM10008949_50040 [Deinococcus humi]
MGQEIEIPDPDTPEYLSTFLTLQRSHPRLAAQLAEAERADPAELLDPYTPRASKITPRHRLNTFVEKNFMRRGLDRKLVMDRQRVFRTTMLVTGGLLVGGLVWSVVAPRPSAQTGQTPAGTGSMTTGTTTPGQGTAEGSTAGAFGPIEGKEEAGTDTSGSSVETAPAGDATFATTPPDSAPQPVSATSGRSTTPPPPEVFNQVANDPYAPAPASVTTPDPAPLAVDSAPTPVAAAPAPAASTPFGGTPEVASDPAPVTVIPAPEAERMPPPSPFADSSPAASTPEVAAPFGGEVVTPAPAAVALRIPPPARPADTSLRPAASPAQTTSATQQEDPPARGAALIYQAPRKETAQSAPRSALIYQSPR